MLFFPSIEYKIMHFLPALTKQRHFSFCIIKKIKKIDETIYNIIYFSCQENPKKFHRKSPLRPFNGLQGQI